MKENLTSFPYEWNAPVDGDILEYDTVQMVQFLEKKVFSQYEPEQFRSFSDRLFDWLSNVETDDDRKSLLRLVPDLFFVGVREFAALYRSAYNGPIFRWFLGIENLNPFDDDVATKVRTLANASWICPVTDSLRINSFMKVLHLSSIDVRPDWRTLQRIKADREVKKIATDNGVKHLILVEDFVGSGTQVKPALKYAAKLFPDIHILFCPLVICPLGHQKILELVDDIENLTYSPVLVLPDAAMQDFETYRNGGCEDKAKFEEAKFLVRQNAALGLKNDKDSFGFKQTGAKVVLYSNCPNNTLPVIHRETETWKALFARVERQE